MKIENKFKNNNMEKIKYIIGNKEHTQDIKNYFASIGFGYEGVSFEFNDNAYFVNPDTKYVDFLRTDRWQFKALVEAGVFEELKYPYNESKPKLKVIQGYPDRGAEVISLLKSMGGVNDDKFVGDSNERYYFIEDGRIDSIHIDNDFFDDYELEVLTLPEKMEKPKQKPKLKVIQGVSSRGDEVIELLESLDGKNIGLNGCCNDAYYFIDNNGKIRARDMLDEFFNYYELEVLTLPEKVEKPKLQVIKGDPYRGDEVIALLESLGGSNIYRFWGNINDAYYYIDRDKTIRWNHIYDDIFTDYDLEFLTLPAKGEYDKKS